MVKSQEQDLMDTERSDRLNQAKQRKTKRQQLQQPLKVVYISNPMRVTTSASGFRAVVQELTGRHSDIAEILTRQPPVDFTPPPPPPAASRPPTVLGPSSEVMSAERFDVVEEFFSGLLSPTTSLLNEPPQLAGAGELYWREPWL